jgi:hypothetical protein
VTAPLLHPHRLLDFNISDPNSPTAARKRSRRNEGRGKEREKTKKMKAMEEVELERQPAACTHWLREVW